MKNLFISRKLVTGALSFFMLFVMAYAVSSSFLFFAKDTYAAGLVLCGTSANADEAVDPTKGGCGFTQFIDLLQRIMNFLLFVLAIPLAAISFAWAGWLYLSSAGNEGKVKQAHEIFGTVALGLCLALAAWLIVHAIVKGLGVSDTYNFLGS